VLYAAETSLRILPAAELMPTSDSGSQLNEAVSTEPDSGVDHGGRQGRIQATRGKRGRLVTAGLVAVLLVAIAVTTGLFDFDQAAARAEARRRAVSALELQGVRLEPVHPVQLQMLSDDARDSEASRVTQVTLADEHLTNGRVDGALLGQLESLGPLVVSLAQTAVSASGIGPVVSQPDVWGLSLLGTGIDDGALSVLEGRQQLRLLSLERTAVSDQGLVHLKQLRGLRQLYLTGTRVTSDGLDQLAGLTRLESVKLGGTEIGDDGLVPLARLPRLKYLTLDRTRVTDGGIPVLAEIRSLEFLDLHGTWVTSNGIKILQDALPDCRIEH